jgi:serine/threonine protein kinase
MAASSAVATLKDYHIAGVIAEGPYATVLKAYHKMTGACYAIKVLSEAMEKALGEKGRAQIESEVFLSSSVIHQSILACKEVLRDETSHYLVMEFMPNGTMLDRVNHMGGLPEQECWSCFRQIASGIEYLHKTMKVCHRDIKLENIMFDENYNCRIIDFGLSHVLGGEELMLTRCGSLAYASPEMLTHGGYTMSTDIWSLGVALYAMITGRLPFRSTDPDSLVSEIMESEFSLPGATNALIEHLLARMLDKDPNSRFNITQVMSHPWVGGPSAEKCCGFNLYACAAASLPSLRSESGRKEAKQASQGAEKSVQFVNFLPLVRGGLLAEEFGPGRRRGGTFVHCPKVRQRAVQRRHTVLAD